MCPISGSNCNFFGDTWIGDTSGIYDFAITSLNQSAISNMWSGGQLNHSTPSYVSATYIAGSNVYDLTIHGLQTYGANADCLQIDSAGGMPQRITITGVTLQGCNLSGGVGYNIDVANAAGQVSISGGSLVSTGATGPLQVGASATVRVSDIQGYNPVGVTAAASTGTTGSTITAGQSPETHYIQQSATFNAAVAKGGQAICTVPSAAVPCVVELGPNESYTVTWSTTQPTYTKDVH
jgi:hypothetical protein